MRPLAALFRLRILLRAGAPLLLIVLLAGCMLPPEPKSDAGRDVFNLYVAILFLAAIVFVGVEGFIIYAIFRYRRKPGDDALPPQHHGNTVIELIWTAIPTAIVLILFTLSVITLGTVNARADDPIVINVDGFQWQWQFEYEDGPTVDPGTVDEPPELVVPVGEPVRLTLNSLDVIHSFYVPQFLIKRDLIPVGAEGEANELEFTVSEEGTYAGQCAEFCGAQHADMTFVVRAVSREAFDEWLAGGAAEETPAPDESECATTVEVRAVSGELAFDTDSIEVPAEQTFCIAFTNEDAIVHDVGVEDQSGERLFDGDDIPAGESIVYVIEGLPAGEYEFICTIHPQQMRGALVASE
jgi:cytochrome c oxidase subunit 2